MKITPCKLLLISVFLSTMKSDGVSLEDFKKIQSADERRAIIRQAAPEQREELKKIHLHLMLLELHGGEEGLKREKETYAARARGLTGMEGIFEIQLTLWDQYIGSVTLPAAKAGKPLDKKTEEEFAKGETLIRARLALVHSLVSQIAASPPALDLEKRIEKLNENLEDKYSIGVWDGVAPLKPPPTKAEWNEIAKEIDQLYEEMKKLPKLTPAEAQKEIDQFPESEMQWKRT